MLEGVGSREYVGIFLGLAVLALLMAAGFRTQDLLLAGLTLGLYGLHLMSIRSIRDEQEDHASLLREVGAALDDLSVDERTGDRSSRRSGAGRSGPGGGGGEGRSGAETAPAFGGRRGATGEEDVMVPRDLRIGTVAIVLGMLEPGDVSRVMSRQEHRPETPFGELAVELDLLRPEQVEELLEVQETGLYSKQKLKQAKEKLRAFLGEA